MQSTLTPALDGRALLNIRDRQSVAAPSLVARIEALAAQSPGTLALVEGGAQLTYADLNRRADRLAAYLVGRGLSAGSCALLLLDRGLDFVVSALAVMKSGAAYVPMDSSTPGDRAAFVLADAGAKVVLTHRGKGAGIAGNADGVAMDIIELDGPGADRIFNADPKNLPSGPGRDDLAYIVYTSGSTGRPKGVEITHANLNGLIDWHQGAFDVTAADREAHVAGLGFDATAWELWPHLTAGASVHIADEATRRSPQALHDWLISERISIAFVPTVITEQLIEMTWPTDTALRMLLTGGEQLHRRPPSGLPFALINNYGPSECTVVATSGPVTPRGAVDDGSPSIGRPIGDTVALVLDENLQQVGAGQPGELCLAGTLVGRGYRNNPTATAGRFVNYSSLTGGFEVRVYRTGDRAKMLENGEIVFLGRLDDQVKIRGYRIEPGEIVSWLDKLPTVAASAAMVRAGVGGDELVAYIVWKSAPHQNATELRKYLAGRLPDYMLPARYVELASLPMTANSKVDRSALPAPAPGNLISDGAAATEIASTNAGVEGRIAAIIASLLGRTSVAAGDNFFLLGGHSMMGVRLASRLREDFGVKLTLRQLFATPTVVGLSATVSRMIDAAAATPGATVTTGTPTATGAPIQPVNPGS